MSLTVACAPSPARNDGAGLRSSQPNIVIVLSDALRAASMSLYGYPRKTTPHLDELASESLVFRRHLVNYPATPFSVSQLHTGRLVPPLLMDFSPGTPPVLAAEPDLPILPAILREAGYRTALISTHPWFNERAMLLQSFDDVYVLRGPQAYVYAPFEELYPGIERFLHEAGRVRKPFFLYVHSMDTHKPYERHAGFESWPDESRWPDLANRYDAEILYTDHWTGRIVEVLREQDLLEETIFVFTSDHGEDLGELGPEWWNFEHGATTHRSLLHVPLVMRFPDRYRISGDWEVPTRHIDLAPTLLGFAVGGMPDGLQADGRDFSAEVLQGEPAQEVDRSSVSHSPRFWSLSDGELDVVFDPWLRKSDLVRWKVDERNYPRPTAVGAPEVGGDLVSRLERVFSRGQRTLARMSRRPPLPGPVDLGVSGWVAPDSAIPSYADDPTDGLWHALPYYRLEAGEEETPEPLQLVWPVAPGDYRLWLRFGTKPGRRYRHNLTVTFPGEAGAARVRINGDRLHQAQADLGVHQVPSLLRVVFSEPEGGVLVTGLILDPQQGAAPPSVRDEETEAQLRALGYL